MARQPIRPGAAPAGRAAAAATPSVTGHQQLERSGAAQAARLRLLTGSGQRGTEGCPLVVFVGDGANGRAQAISMSQTTVEPDPMVVEVLGAIGVDLLGWRSWPPSPELLRRATAVVVMGYDSQTLD